ncbi:MAG: Class cytochrome family [Acidobacteriota bacterium]|jgi:hypothetical protein|nr:Class cytochrome family [Acidobacteriota bacterium]
MRLKLIVLLAVALGYLAVLFACTTAPAGLTQNSNAKANVNATANTNAAPATAPAAAPAASGQVTWKHAEMGGTFLPDASATLPDKTIILAKDSEKAKPNSGPLKPEAAFDHVKHSTVATYSLSGTTTPACVDCHHTDQPSAPAGQEYLKKFERKAALTAKELETSKEVVKTCRACHLQASEEETDDYPPKSVTYPEALKRPPSGKLDNETAYHLNCNSCHDAVKKRNPASKAPQTCVDCHSN